MIKKGFSPSLAFRLLPLLPQGQAFVGLRVETIITNHDLTSLGMAGGA